MYLLHLALQADLKAACVGKELSVLVLWGL